ncbi:MAG: hypothetical protein JKY22_02765 [Flavobacteriaceae bacterium]|nr:hypothetical protein [Flavobacteriaceae bacterium]
MDQLEALKKEWQTRDQEFPKLTYKDIYPMLLKKSSSILKWIVVISLCEILFWILLSLVIPESSNEFYEELGLKSIFKWMNIINYAVVAFFIYLFYRNYKKIQVTNSIKILIENILKTRKAVHYFVYYNIGMAIALLVGTNLYYYSHQEKLMELLKNQDIYGAIPAEAVVNKFFIYNFIAGIMIIGILMLFYFLLYGLLLRRLKRNYKELKKIEV